ncbi:unnamed protein product, partial [Pylaiella littoralis]
ETAGAALTAAENKREDIFDRNNGGRVDVVERGNNVPTISESRRDEKVRERAAGSASSIANSSRSCSGARERPEDVGTNRGCSAQQWLLGEVEPRYPDGLDLLLRR